jgi:ornithine cyclodeaminase/alanine dehydrogenase-like protein (mu-crystallin family)
MQDCGERDAPDPTTMLHLDDATILDLLDLRSVTACVADAYAAWGHGHAATTQRLRAAAGDGMASAMAAVVPPYSGGKVYATRDGRFTFVMVLFDLDGRFLCTLDGDAVTRLRTPATSALALRHLAVPGAHVAALVGGGRQAWQHLLMLRHELPLLTELRVYARRPDAAELLVKHAIDQGIPAVTSPSAAAAVDGAEVVVTVTSATDPLFPADVVGDRTLLCAVGATKAGRCEIGPDVVARCVTVVADDVAGSRVECGDLLRAEAAGQFSWGRAVELHAVVSGSASVPRAGDGPVLFESQGVALQDVAAAGLAWQRFEPSTTRE